MMSNTNKEKVWSEICSFSPVYIFELVDVVYKLRIPYQYHNNSMSNNMSAITVLQWPYRNYGDKFNIEILEALIDVFGIQKAFLLSYNDKESVYDCFAEIQLTNMPELLISIYDLNNREASFLLFRDRKSEVNFNKNLFLLNKTIETIDLRDCALMKNLDLFMMLHVKESVKSLFDMYGYVINMGKFSQNLNTINITEYMENDFVFILWVDKYHRWQIKIERVEHENFAQEKDHEYYVIFCGASMFDKLKQILEFILHQSLSDISENNMFSIVQEVMEVSNPFKMLDRKICIK